MEKPDWSHLVAHTDNRSGRHHSDTDILYEWAVEAYYDENAALIDPDYNSESGQSLRVIGWSTEAGFLITVILVLYKGKLFAASAWKSNRKDQRLYAQMEEGEEP